MRRRGSSRAWRWVAGTGIAALTGLLAVVVAGLPEEPGRLAALARETVPESGAGHPVTAVLLDLRAYDTWLEVAVLLAAAMATLVVARDHDPGEPTAGGMPGPVQLRLAQVLVPVLALVGVYLLSRGTFTAGGAFQAGAVLGAAGLLLWLSGYPSVTALHGAAFRLVVAAGFLAFLIAAVVSVAAGRGALEHPAGAAPAVIIALEAAVTVSVAVTLALLFVAARRAGGGSSPGADR